MTNSFLLYKIKILNKIQRSSDISVITTNKEKEQSYNIIETMNHNNKPIEIRNKIDRAINELKTSWQWQ